ncbi:MAG: RNA polymerase sigma factor [Bacteriovorax sp.]|nr:RNA polymerase sigma factor [Rhizobacter sp.]
MDSSLPSTNEPVGTVPDDLIGRLEQGRMQFLLLVDHIRPELHRYCTRMTGSVADGEDVVQETLARAYYEVSQMKALPHLRPWLFRIAHNRAIDHWRHEAHRASEPLDAALELADAAALEPDSVLARNQAVRAAISCFLELAPAQRGCVILKDVLEHSLDEIAVELNLSVPAVKAALSRGRAALHRLTEAPPPAPQARQMSMSLRRYASLFNAHDWEGVRAMLAGDVKLDLVSRRKAAGRSEVGSYFNNYDRAADWHLTPAWLDGREVLAVLPAAHASATHASVARYFIALEWVDGGVTSIRDFRYVSYITQETLFDLTEFPSHERPT